MSCHYNYFLSLQTGGYVLGFRIDPQEKLKSTLQQIHSLYRVFSAHPIFGVEYQTDDDSVSIIINKQLHCKTQHL